MKIKIPQIDEKEKIIYISFGVYIFFGILSQTFFYKYFAGTLYFLVLIFCFLSLLIYEATNRKTNLKEFSGFMICTLLCVLVLGVNHSGNSTKSLALSFLYIYALRKSNFKQVSIWVVIVSAMALAITIISGKIGIITNHTWELYGRKREYLGFLYALYPSTIFFNIVGLYIYYREKRIHFSEIIVLGIISIGLYQRTNSRATCTLTLILLVLAYAKKKELKILNNIFIKIGAIISFVVSSICSFYFTFAYSTNGLIKKMPWDIAKRFYLGQQSVLKYGIHFLGQDIMWYGNGLDSSGKAPDEVYDYVDNLYIQIAQHYGVAFLIIFIVIVTVGIYKLVKAEEWYLYVIIAIVAVHCIIDDLSLYIFYNTFWIPVGGILVQRNMRKKFIDIGRKRT